MKLRIMSSVLLLSLCHTSFADLPPKPASCPSISAIQAIGITYIEQDDGAWYAGVLTNNYATNDKWTFALGSITAASESEARQKATDSLASLTLQRGPMPTNFEKWVCLYNNKAGYNTVAITPAMYPLNAAIKHFKS